MGLPSDIVSDRDSRFISHLWQELTKHLGINLLMSTAFHPQANGQQDDWAELLLLAEHAYNTAVSETTKTSPFFANYGYQETQWIRPAASEANFTNPASELHWESQWHRECPRSLSRIARSLNEAEKHRGCPRSLSGIARSLNEAEKHRGGLGPLSRIAGSLEEASGIEDA
jgi:hypothetical protein